jgi:excisionase family DNA binding protein
LHSVGESSGEHALAAALIELLASSPSAMQRLVDLLEDRGLIHAEPTAPVYTVASLADALGVSAKVVRGAIARGELDAVKRGGRWIIPAEAVDAWAHPPAVAAVCRVRRSRTKSNRPLGSAIALLPGASSGRRRL